MLKSSLKKALVWFAGEFGSHRFLSRDPHLWVLMYHRILPKTDPRFDSEEPGMIVTPQTFDRHLAELKSLFSIVPLSEWIERRKNGSALPQRACAITFDDGWLDNFEYALPVLQRHQVPATVFVVSNMVGTNSEFWPNRMSRLLSLRDRQHKLSWLKDCEQYVNGGAMNRERISTIINYCKRFSDAELSQLLEETEQQLGIAVTETPSLMNWEQLRAMQGSGLVEIGSHTCNHFRLTEGLPNEIATREIVESQRLLTQQLERSIDLFCYPNGNVSAFALRLVRERYKAAVTTKRGINTASADAHVLSRIGVHEDIADTSELFKARLSGWV